MFSEKKIQIEPYFIYFGKVPLSSSALIGVCKLIVLFSTLQLNFVKFCKHYVLLSMLNIKIYMYI